MFNSIFTAEGPGGFFWPCTTPEQSLALGRALAVQWRQRPISLAREQGSRSALLSLGTVTGLMAGGGSALDYGVRARGEFQFLREATCPAALFFREHPQPGVELMLPYEETRQADLLLGLTRLLEAGRESGLRPAPGQWLQYRGRREEYFQKLVSLGSRELAGSCCRFRGPDREAQALGNQALSVLGVRAMGGGLLTLDRLGRLVSLRREGHPTLDWSQLRPLLEGEDARRLGGMVMGGRAPWLEDGLMAGILLLSLLQRQGSPALEGTQLQLALPMIRLIAPQDRT